MLMVRAFFLGRCFVCVCVWRVRVFALVRLRVFCVVDACVYSRVCAG